MITASASANLIVYCTTSAAFRKKFFGSINRTARRPPQIRVAIQFHWSQKNKYPSPKKYTVSVWNLGQPAEASSYKQRLRIKFSPCNIVCSDNLPHAMCFVRIIFNAFELPSRKQYTLGSMVATDSFEMPVRGAASRSRSRTPSPLVQSGLNAISTSHLWIPFHSSCALFDPEYRNYTAKLSPLKYFCLLSKE